MNDPVTRLQIRPGRRAPLLAVVLLAAGGSVLLRAAPASGCAPIPLAAAPEEVTEPIPGACHRVERGQTLYSIARAYQVPLEVVTSINGIADPARIQAGHVLFVPGAAAPIEVAPTTAPILIWPLEGRVTSAFGPAGGRPHHAGIDIDGVKGQLIRAAAAGQVVWAGWERGYGLMVVLDHGDELSTLYAHAERLLVGSEEWVEAGEPVAQVGDTGNARGDHLHFEVRREGRPLNPLLALGGSVARSSAGAR